MVSVNVVESLDGLRSDHAVGVQAQLPLGTAHGRIRSVFEPKVDPRGEQTEVCKTFLQVSNVITYLRAAGIIFQNAVAQAEASQLDFVKRLLSQHSVDNDPAILLELTQT